MLFKKLLIFFLTIFLPFCSFGQAKTYKLVGQAKTNGFSYLYALVFEVKKSTISGYSVTKQPNGAEFKAEVKGTINRKEHTISFTETKSLDKDPHKDMAICFFSAQLTYKLLGEKYIVTGPFSGKDLDNKTCSDGTMVFEDMNTSGSVFYKKKETPVVKPVIADTIVTKEPALPDNAITAGVQKQIDWQSDSCTIEIWDGGVIDGDVISVLLNDKPLLTNYSLVKARKRVRVPVSKTVNVVTIIAEDEGINPPNTAEIALIDGEAVYKITAFNKKGARAQIVLRRK